MNNSAFCLASFIVGLLVGIFATSMIIAIIIDFKTINQGNHIKAGRGQYNQTTGVFELFDFTKEKND